MEFKVFTKPDCNWCKKAKELLNQYKLYFEEYMYGEDFEKPFLVELLGLKPDDKIMLPQIFKIEDGNAILIGGYSELEKYIDKQRLSTTI